MTTTDAADGCSALLQDGVLTVGNRQVEHRWVLDQSLPRATALRDLASGRDWIAAGDGRIATGDGCAQVSRPGAFTYAFARLEAPP